MKLLEPPSTPHTPPSKSSLDPMRVQTENVPFHLLAQEVPVGLVVPCDPVTRQRVCDRISFQGCDLTHLTHHSTWLRHGLKQQARGGGNFWNGAINHCFISWCRVQSRLFLLHLHVILNLFYAYTHMHDGFEKRKFVFISIHVKHLLH